MALDFGELWDDDDVGGFDGGFEPDDSDLQDDYQYTELDLANSDDADEDSRGRSRKLPGKKRSNRYPFWSRHSSSDIPWRFLIVVAVVITAVVLLIVFWDLVEYVFTRLAAWLVIIVLAIGALRTMLGTGGRRRW